MSIRFLLMVAIAFVAWRLFTVVRRMMQQGKRHEGPDPFAPREKETSGQIYRDVQDAHFEEIGRTEERRKTSS